MDGHERPTTEPAPWSARKKALLTFAALVVAAAAFVAGSGGDLGWLAGANDVAIQDADWGRAETVAVDDGPAGARVEVAPVRGGDGRCWRVVLADEAGGARCGDGPLNAWDAPDFELRRNEQYFGSLVEHAVRVDQRWVVALSGAMHPDVARVTAHFGDGSEYSFVTLDPGGWFVAVLPEDVADPAVADGRLVNAVVRLELFDAEGTRVATVDPSRPVGSG